MTPLRRYFNEQGWGSQSRLAARVGLRSGYLGELADGKKRPGVEVAEALERETGIPFKTLMQMKDSAEGEPA